MISGAGEVICSSHYLSGFACELSPFRILFIFFNFFISNNFIERRREGTEGKKAHRPCARSNRGKKTSNNESTKIKHIE